MRGWLVPWAFAVWVAAATGFAFADEASAEAIRLHYRAPAMCKDADAFFWDLKARAPRVRRAAEGEPSRELVITIDQTAKASSGVVYFIDVEKKGSERRLTARTCDELTSALALVAALSIDPHSHSDNGPTLAASSAPPSSSAAPSAPRVFTAPPPAAVAPATSLAVHVPRWVVGAGGALEVRSEPAPALFVASGYFQMERAGEGTWLPLFSVAVGASNEAHVDLVGTRAVLRWWTAELSACPARWSSTKDAWVLRTCGLIESGALQANASVDSGSQYHPWFAPGLALRLEFRPLPYLDLNVRTGLRFPLLPGELDFQSLGAHYQTSHLLGFAGFGAGVRFP